MVKPSLAANYKIYLPCEGWASLKGIEGLKGTLDTFSADEKISGGLISRL